MKTKTIVTFALLAFVAWSFTVAVGKVLRTPDGGSVEALTAEDRDGKHSFGKFFNRVTGAETWLRTITGVSFLLVGVYITMQQIFLS